MTPKQKIADIIAGLSHIEALELVIQFADHCGVDPLDLIKGLATWGKEEPSSDEAKNDAEKPGAVAQGAETLNKELFDMLQRIVNAGQWYPSALEIDTYQQGHENGEDLVKEARSVLERAKEDPANYGFKVGDRVTWSQGIVSYEISSIGKGGARFKPGSGLYEVSRHDIPGAPLGPIPLSKLRLAQPA